VAEERRKSDAGSGGENRKSQSRSSEERLDDLDRDSFVSNRSRHWQEIGRDRTSH
jgi:hypothetical protein